MTKNPFDDGLMNSKAIFRNTESLPATEVSSTIPPQTNPFDDGLMKATAQVANPFDDGLMKNQTVAEFQPTITSSQLQTFTDKEIDPVSAYPDDKGVRQPNIFGKVFDFVGEQPTVAETDAEMVNQFDPVSVAVGAAETVLKMPAMMLNFGVGEGGALGAIIYDKIKNGSVYKDRPNALTDSTSDTLASFVTGDPLEQAADYIVDPAKQQRVNEFMKDVERWRAEWPEVMMEYGLTDKQKESYRKAREEAGSAGDNSPLKKVMEPQTDTGKVFAEIAALPMTWIDKAATKFGHQLNNPDDPRDAEFFRLLMLGGGVWALPKGVKTTANVLRYRKFMQEFRKLYAENPIATLEELGDFANFTEAELADINRHLYKYYGEEARGSRTSPMRTSSGDEVLAQEMKLAEQESKLNTTAKVYELDPVRIRKETTKLMRKNPNITAAEAELGAIENLKVADYNKVMSPKKIVQNTIMEHGGTLLDKKLMEIWAETAKSNKRSINDELLAAGIEAERAKVLTKEIESGLKRAESLIDPEEPLRNTDPYRSVNDTIIDPDTVTVNKVDKNYKRDSQGRRLQSRRQNPAPEITDKLLRDIDSGLKRDYTTRFWKNPRYYLKHPMQTIREAFGEAGVKYIAEPIVDAFAGANRHIDWSLKQIDNFAKSIDLSKESRLRVGAYAKALEENGKAYVEASGMKIPSWEELTIKEQAAYNSLRPIYNRLYEIANEANRKSGLADLEYRENYTPNQMVSMYADAAFKDGNLWHNNFKDLQPHINQIRKPWWSFKRSSVVDALELDAIEQLRKHTNSVLYHRYMSPTIAAINEIMSVHDVTKAKNWNHDVTKNPTWSIKAINKEAFAALANYVDFVQNRRIKEIPNYPELSNMLLAVSRNIGSSWVSANLSTVIAQTTSIANTLMLSDPISLNAGIAKTMVPANWERAIRVSRRLKERIGTFDAVFHDYNKFSGNRGPIRKGMRTVLDTSMIPMRVIDSYQVMVAWQTGEFYAKNYYKLKGMDAVRYADEFMQKTQAGTTFIDMPPIQRSVVGKALTTLQSFQINQFNVLMDDVNPLVKGNKRNKLERVMRPVLAMLGMATVNYVFQEKLNTYSPYPSPIDAFADKLEQTGSNALAVQEAIYELTEIMPFISAAKYGKGLGGPVGITLQEAPGFLKRQYQGTFVDAAVKAQNEGADKWDTAIAVLTHPQISAAFRMGGTPIMHQIIKYLRARKKAEQTGEDIPTFNQFVGTYNAD